MFNHDGVSDVKYSNLSKKEKSVFDLITSQGGGVTHKEITDKLNIDYKEQVDIIKGMVSKGISIRAIGVGHWNERFYYSPYADDHNERIK